MKPGPFITGCLAIAALMTALGCSAHCQSRGPSELTKAPACGREPASGSPCFVVVKASEDENRTGLMLVKGGEYRITVPGEQMWCDADRSSRAPFHDPQEPNVFMKMMSVFKKAGNSEYFSLIAEVGGKQYDLSSANPSILKASDPGELILYPNDAAGWYWNNSGEIVVEIQRVDPAQ